MNVSTFPSEAGADAARGFGRPKKAFLNRNPLAPYPRCRCGQCLSCRDNEKWDRIFAKFALKDYREVKGLFQSALRDM